MLSLIKKIVGTKHQREMKTIQPVIDKINSLESSMKDLTDEQLQAKTDEFKSRYQNGETLEQMLPEAFAVCREAAWRVLGMRHYDVQLIGGYILNRGSIAEMRTGEGKTLSATLPVYLNAVTGKGVHVVTVNDYLASRDALWMGKLYNWLGLSVGIITNDLSDTERSEAYRSDITYATNNELGFDYLRDNMKFRLADYVQRPLHFAIVDECDSILIDEARTPLIISGPAEDNTLLYKEIHEVAKHLKLEEHFTMEEKNRSVSITEEGNSKLESLMGIENVYDPQHIDKLHHVYQALKAIHLFRKDVDYMVKGDEIVIVDEFTGRLMDGRRWSDGLHQAVEAKEGVNIKNENQTLASITFQNYFRMYDKLSGMTGTADTEEVEFKKIYNLSVSIIPTNKPMVRKDLDDVVYKDERAKFNAIIEDILIRQKNGQPVLVGTTSIEKSEALGNALASRSIPHHVLNAKYHEKEAEIVAQAGRAGAITIATNMAGRGTDILLGGNAEFLAAAENEDPQSDTYKASLKKYESQCEKEKQQVLDAGGLYIIGTERHESRRIDNQLRGRAGRQGDPGESRFYLSLEDELMRKFNGDRIKYFMDKLNVPDDEPIEAKMVSRSIEGAQRKVEGHNFDIRKHLLEYDDVMNLQRNKIYSMRKSLLEEQDGDETKIESRIKEMMGECLEELLDVYANESVKPKDWNIDGLKSGVDTQYGTNVKLDSGLTIEEMIEQLQPQVSTRYNQQKSDMSEIYDDVQKSLLLGAIDHYWKEHLYRVDKIRETVNLKAYAQKDPLNEYRRDTFDAFGQMESRIRKDVVEKFMKLQIVYEEEQGQKVLDSLKPKEKEPKDMVMSSGPTGDDQPSASQSSFGMNRSQGPQGMSRSERRAEKKKKKKKLF